MYWRISVLRQCLRILLDKVDLRLIVKNCGRLKRGIDKNVYSYLYSVYYHTVCMFISDVKNTMCNLRICNELN